MCLLDGIKAHTLSLDHVFFEVAQEVIHVILFCAEMEQCAEVEEFLFGLGHVSCVDSDVAHWLFGVKVHIFNFILDGVVSDVAHGV